MIDPEFCALILTHGRPDNLKTLRSLETCGYTGPWFLVIDDQDPTADEYIERYGEDRVIIFSKEEIGQTFDKGDNFGSAYDGVIMFARNASSDIAKSKGYRYFIQLDDDYSGFYFRFDNEYRYVPATTLIKDLDRVWGSMLALFKNVPWLSTLAMAQGGDFLGGKDSDQVATIGTKRKAMNSFICDTERPLLFPGRMNEDVNAYTELQRRGAVSLTALSVSLGQDTTQGSTGGMTDTYLESGTYVKSFYSIMRCPSAVRVAPLNSTHTRLHHLVNYSRCAPMILNEKHKMPT